MGVADRSDRRALLLSGSIGMGHDVRARACADSLHARGWRTDTLDAMALLGGAQHRAGEAVFRTLLAIPGSYDALHFAGLRTGSAVARFLDEQAVRRIVPRLRGELARSPAALVISVFATGASAMARLRPGMPEARTVTFCSDLNPHRLWVHPGTDGYLVTSPTSAAFVRRFDPDARVVVVPTPVRAEFAAAPDRATARAALGLPPDGSVALLMAGAWGLGPLVEVAQALARAGVHTLAVAGRNAALERRLRAAARDTPGIVPFGLTDRVPELMSAADVVVTTSGDTCAEARTVGRRMVLLDVVAGHGRENLQHELEVGGACVASTEPDLLVAAVLRAVEAGADPEPDRDRAARWERGLDELLAVVGIRADPAE